MIITRERYLDDASRYHLSLVLQTRTREMHSLLSDAPEDVRERLGDLLAQALDQIQIALKPVTEQPPPEASTSDFGCGT